MVTKWSKEIGVGITVCDTDGIILWMNDLAAKIFRKSGGIELIGKSLEICHPPSAYKKILELFEKKEPYCYTVEISGSKSMLYQSPWYEEGNFMGFVEFIYTLPEEIPNLTEIHWVKK